MVNYFFYTFMNQGSELVCGLNNYGLISKSFHSIAPFFLFWSVNPEN